MVQKCPLFPSTLAGHYYASIHTDRQEVTACKRKKGKLYSEFVFRGYKTVRLREQ